MCACVCRVFNRNIAITDVVICGVHQLLYNAIFVLFIGCMQTTRIEQELSSRSSLELQSKMDNLHIQLLLNSNRLSQMETTLLNRSLDQCRSKTREMEVKLSSKLAFSHLASKRFYYFMSICFLSKKEIDTLFEGQL